MPADRSALGAFLRSRRDRLTPAQAGIRAFPGPRRVPGLRKEEPGGARRAQPRPLQPARAGAAAHRHRRGGRGAVARPAAWTTSSGRTCATWPRRRRGAGGPDPRRRSDPTRACCG
nr:hypothetical protein [Angustibacter aerolatus]